MKKSAELKLFKGKLLDFVTNREISSQVATADEVRTRSQPYIIVGYLLNETPSCWLVGDEHGVVTKSIKKADVTSIEVSPGEEPAEPEATKSDPFQGYAFGGVNN